jgi:hypothetical protein
LAIEAIIHQRVAERFISQNPDWVLISNAIGVSFTPTNAMKSIAEDIVDVMLGLLNFNFELMKRSPFNLMILDTVAEVSETKELGTELMITSCEVTIFMYLKKMLQNAYGNTWWTAGVPEKVRTECVRIREEEGAFEHLPPEAYLNLIHLREIAIKNWDST